MKAIPKNDRYRRAVELLFLIYLLVIVFPYDLFIHDSQWQETIRILVFIIYLVFFVYYAQREGIQRPKFKRWQIAWLWVLPTFLICGSNMIYLAISNRPLNPLNHQVFWFSLPLVTLLVVMEELIFRGLLIDNVYMSKSPLYAVLMSSIIFGLFHLLNLFSNTNILAVLIQVLYSFVLGIVCATAYVITKNFLFPIAIHVAFNVLNNQLYPLLVSADPDWLYYVINGAIGVVVLGYCIWLLMRRYPKTMID